MINPKELIKELSKEDLIFFSGVPDSTFKELISEIPKENHRKAINECEAIAFSMGYHLATGKIGITYMQNSGLGKVVNPLTSLLSKEVYSIPSILIIGYRGKPETFDEPQHKMMGRLTTPLLKLLDVPFRILPKDLSSAINIIKEIKKIAEETNSPVALIIEKGTFSSTEEIKKKEDPHEIKREDAIKEILKLETRKISIVATTGKISRELFECRTHMGENHSDFLTVGGMGCASAIAAEIALEKPKKELFCLDGDGASLMQMGTFASIGNLSPKNFTHILFDNSAYDSTGGQDTISNSIDFERIALGCRYKFAKTINKLKEIGTTLDYCIKISGPKLLIIKVKKGSRKDLGRPTKTPLENKEDFIKNLK